MAKKNVIYSVVEVRLHQSKEALSVDDAKQILGWETEPEGEKWESWAFRDLEGKKVRLLNNPTNRPFRMGLAKRYSSEILRGKWAMNGETVIVDRLGHVQSGQHRLAALVLAEQERKKNPEYWRTEYSWRGPVKMETLVVYGISEKPEVVDTLDIGQKRSLGDVIFRNQDFGDLGERDQKKVSNMLAGATRLAWLRCGGLRVSDAPAFLHSEALDFVEDHEGLHQAVLFVFNEEGGAGVDGRKISSFISLGYASALAYLMAAAKTDPEGEVDMSLLDKAQEFWTLFASGAGLEKGNPILVLRNLLPKIDASGAMGRDEVVSSVIKAWNLWIDGKKATTKDVRVKKTKNEAGKMILGEEPRIGGLDIERVDLEDDEEDLIPEIPEKVQKGSKSKGGWTVGDSAWVKDLDEGDHWFGTLIEKIDLKDPDGEITGTRFMVEEASGEGTWEVDPKVLVINRPK